MLLDELLAVIEDEVKGLDDGDRDAFWRVLGGACLKKARKRVGYVERSVAKKPPMDEFEAQKFEKTIMPIGRHKGIRVLDAPLDYLANLCDDHEFIRDLRRYIESSRYKSRCRSDDHSA